MKFTGISIVEGLAMPRKDSDVRQKFFKDPPSLAAGAVAAQMALAGTTSSPGAASSTTQPQTQGLESALQRSQAEVEKLRAALKRKREGPPRTEPRAGPKAGPKARAAPKSETKSRREAQKQHSCLKAVRAGKCFRHNQGGCKVFNCEWPHDCSICGKQGCAAYLHDA